MKQFIEKLEVMIDGWLKPLPRLPISFKKWVSENLWWIVLIGVILSSLGLLAMIGSLATIISLLGGVSYFGFRMASLYTGWHVFASVISLLFMAGTIVLTAMSISHLKVGKKKGWTLLFLVLLLQSVAVIVNAILTYSVVSFIIGIIVGAVCLAIGAYLLFELRAYFGEGFTKKVEPTEN